MNRPTKIILAGIVLVCGGCAALTTNGKVAVKDLRCEYLTNPLGIDVAKPRLSWVLKSTQRGQMQIAYQILVAGSPEILKKNQGDLWDTGKVSSDQSIHIVYAGKPLVSRARCCWKARVWDKDGKPSRYSQPAWWETGLLETGDWQAKWLSAPVPQDKSIQVEPSPFFRNTFTLEKAVEKARGYICGLGYYELYLNGRKVGDHVLDPAFTRYDRRVLYVTYDVTDYLSPGKNAIGVVLGNGWYNMHTRCVWDFYKAPWRDRPTMLCQLEVKFTDGSSKIITSDSAWKVSTGPIVFESIRNGESYDARLEKPGWNTADYNDTAWAAAHIVPGPKGRLSSQMLPPIKVTRTIKPVKLTEPKPGCFVFDMGQNMAGWAQLKVSGSAGTKVVMKYGERLNPDGTLDQKEIGKFIQQWEPQTDTYISKGKGTEFWEPRFVYHGFQYVQVTGLPEKPSLDTLRGRVVHTSFEAAGYFECSNELFNKIQQNTLWSYISNFHGYPTDCPHREKNGWTGDAHLAAEQGLYNFASAAAYTKWMNDFKDEQRDSGELPGIVPTSGWGYQWGNGPAWDSAYLIIPWYMYRYCGDTQILAAHYDRFKRYVDYLTSRADNYTVSIGLGDWVPAKTQTPEAVTSTAFYYADAVITGLAGRLLGKHDEAEKYFTLARQIKDAWNKTFYKGDGIFANGSQTALSFALYGDLVPESERQKTLARLVENIEKNNYNIDTGILGAKCIFTVLSENGRHDVAYKMATQTTYPSYGHWISRGATTLWEDWSGSASLNHIMLGDISAWFYKYLAGININPDPLKGTGFKHIVIRPRPVGDITWVRAEHNSMYGPIRSSWRKENGIFTLDVTIPVNTTAKVYMPANDSESVTEGGQPANKAKEVQLVNMKDGNAVFAVGSGQYRFASKLPQ
jgi:alpha-L-rhamnosidase